MVTKRKFKFTFNSHFAEGEQERESSFEGIVNNFERRYIETNSDYSRDRIKKYMSLNECSLWR